MGCCHCCYYCWFYDCFCEIERVISSEREVLSMRAFCIVRYLAGCEDQPCS
jgi:hypothetical protein